MLVAERGESVVSVLVTGGAGFIGSHVVDRLVAIGEDALVVDDLSRGCLDNISKHAEFAQLDVCDIPALVRLFEGYRPDSVIHLAARTSASASWVDPAADAYVNILGTIGVMQASISVSTVKRITFASSAAVYGDSIDTPAKEDVTPLEPISPYGLSKLTGERYLSMYGRSGLCSISILRFSNVYGPRQRVAGEAAVVPAFIGALSKNEPVVITGNGTQTRDFVYVEDVVDAIVRSLSVHGNLVCNISSDSSVDILRLCEMLRGMIVSTSHLEFVAERAGEIRHSRLSNMRATDILGWSPATSIENGLIATVTAYQGTKW